MSSEPVPVRRYHVFMRGQLAVVVAGTPGILISSSMPPPAPGEAMVTHPFASAIFLMAENEGELGHLLRNAPDLDTFLAGVRSAGYRVEDADG